MSDVTAILSRMQQGDRVAEHEALPLVYGQLRRMASARLSHERPGQTLEATALVHEAWIRIAGRRWAKTWQNREAFFATAAEIMRRILVDVARRKSALKRGAEFRRSELQAAELAHPELSVEVVLVSDALEELIQDDPIVAELVKLHYFAGLSLEEAGETLGLSRATAYRKWIYARAFLRAALEE